MKVKCPVCQTEEDTDETGYTPIFGEWNPHLVISVPTCGVCGHQYKDNMNLWVIPLYYFDPNMRVLGGLILTSSPPESLII